MPSARFEPAIPAVERLQTHAVEEWTLMHVFTRLLYAGVYKFHKRHFTSTLYILHLLLGLQPCQVTYTKHCLLMFLQNFIQFYADSSGRAV